MVGEIKSQSKKEKNEGYDQVTYAYATFNNIPAEEDLDTVEEAINEITRKKIHTEVTLMPIAIADYSNKVSLALQGGEKIDVYQSMGDFNNYVSTDMAYDITDLLKEEGEGIVDTIQGLAGGLFERGTHLWRSDDETSCFDTNGNLS